MVQLQLLTVLATAAVALGGTVIPLEHCISCVTPGATPTGKIVKIGGVDTYVAKHRGRYDKDTALLLLTDIFGLAPVHSKLLADDFAEQGYQTYIPDYLNGDPVPEDALSDPTFDWAGWSARHGRNATLPPLHAVISGLKRQGVKKFGATGYCFGALYSTILAQTNTIRVATTAHPSSITIPDDWNLLLQESRVPLQIHTSDLDSGFPPASAAATDDLLGGGKYKPGYNRTNWIGVPHGFAVRANMSNPVEREAKIGSFKGALRWLDRHL